MSVLLMFQLFRYQSTRNAAIVHLGRRKSLKANTSEYLLYSHRKTSGYMYSGPLHFFVYEAAVLNSQTSENVWYMVQAALPTKADAFCLVHTHVCSFYRFPSVVQPQSHSWPFRSNTDGKQCKSWISLNPFC